MFSSGCGRGRVDVEQLIFLLRFDYLVLSIHFCPRDLQVRGLLVLCVWFPQAVRTSQAVGCFFCDCGLKGQLWSIYGQLCRVSGLCWNYSCGLKVFDRVCAVSENM